MIAEVRAEPALKKSKLDPCPKTLERPRSQYGLVQTLSVPKSEPKPGLN